MDNSYLNEIANTAKEEHENGTFSTIPQAVPINEVVKEEAKEAVATTTDGIVQDEINSNVVNTVEDDEDELIVIVPETTDAGTTAPTNENGAVHIVTMDDAKKMLADMPDEVVSETYEKLNSDVFKYKKELMIKQGFTNEEADNAAKNRFARNAKKVNEEYLEKNPKLGIIEIDKRNEDTVEFTDEEREKMQKVNVIQLKVVHDESLKTLKIKKGFKQEHLAKYMREIDGSLCHYSVPLPVYGDMVTFNGAQTMQMVSIIAHDDDLISEVLERKATLIYDRLSYGSLIEKFDSVGGIKMSYKDFINSFMYQDIDVAIYGIIVASSMEYSETELRCTVEHGGCDAVFKQKYNMKQLLQPEMLEYFKDRFESILGNRENKKVLSELHKDITTLTRVKSSFTENVYDMEFPTLGKAINHYKQANMTDPQEIYNSTLGLYINTIYIHDSSDDSYIPVEGSDILSVFKDIPQHDLELLANYIEKNMTFTPKFMLMSKCTKCGKSLVNDLSIDQMVFLRAQDSSIQIK